MPTSKPKKGVRDSISAADLGCFWVPLGAHIRIYKGYVGPRGVFVGVRNEKETKYKMFKIYRKLQVGMALGRSKRGPSWRHVGVMLAS